MFNFFWSSQEPQANTNTRPQQVSTNSWFGWPAVSSPTSSCPATPDWANSNTSFTQTPGGDQPYSLAHVSPVEAAGIVIDLQGKSVDELNKLLSDKEAYQEFLLSIDLVKVTNNLRDELRNETMKLARENLAKESLMTELRNQCMIIRTTELASAQEKLNDLNKQKAEIMKNYSPASFIHRLQESMDKADEDSETLHKRLLEKEIDIATFIQKDKKLRVAYHKCALTRLAANISL